MDNDTIVMTDGFSTEAAIYCDAWKSSPDAVCVSRRADIATDPVEVNNNIAFVRRGTVKYVLSPFNGSPQPAPSEDGADQPASSPTQPRSEGAPFPFRPTTTATGDKSKFRS